MTDQPLPDPHPNRDACLALIGQRVKSRHPKFLDCVVEGRVIGYDPFPWSHRFGMSDYLVIEPDKIENAVCHPPCITVSYDWLITGDDHGSPTNEEMERKRSYVKVTG